MIYTLIKNNKLYSVEIVKTFKAGLSLTGTEVKILRNSAADLSKAYVQCVDKVALIKNIILYDKHHVFGNSLRLLLHENEILYLQNFVHKNRNIVVGSIYSTKTRTSGLLKAEIICVSGTSYYDRKKFVKKQDLIRKKMRKNHEEE